MDLIKLRVAFDKILGDRNELLWSWVKEHSAEIANLVSRPVEGVVIPKIADTDWMPVEDLPDDNSGYYLCYTKYIYNDDKPQYFYETARIEDRQWYAPNGENITDNVIYWKELPKAPH